MSSNQPGAQATESAGLLERSRLAIVDAANGRPFDRRPISELLLIIALMSGLVASVGLGQVIWSSSPVHHALLFGGFYAVGLIAIFGAWVVFQDG